MASTATRSRRSMARPTLTRRWHRSASRATSRPFSGLTRASTWFVRCGSKDLFSPAARTASPRSIFTTSTVPSTSPAPAETVTVGVSRQRRLVLAGGSAGLFLAALDTYVVVTVLPRMMFDLALPIDRIEQATPIITGFLVGYIVTMPLMGALSDLHGRGRVYLGSLAIFSLGSVLTATAGAATFPNETVAGLPW